MCGAEQLLVHSAAIPAALIELGYGCGSVRGTRWAITTAPSLESVSCALTAGQGPVCHGVCRKGTKLPREVRQRATWYACIHASTNCLSPKITVALASNQAICFSEFRVD